VRSEFRDVARLRRDRFLTADILASMPLQAGRCRAERFQLTDMAQPQIVIPLSAEIGNSVARLSDCIAEAGQNNCRNPQYPEIPQPSQCAHVFSFSSEQSIRAEMSGDPRRVPARRDPIVEAAVS
jgi:hypothetical protein